MPRKQKPLRIAEGIYREGDRLVARARSGSSRNGKQLVERGYFDLGTSIATMQRWRREKSRELDDAKPVELVRGSLAADIDRWVSKLEGRYQYDAGQILKHWKESTLGGRPRADVTRLDVIEQRSIWKKAGVAANTINKRVSRLRVMYRDLNGDPTIPNPTDKIEKLPEPEGEAREIPAPIVRLILDELVDHGRARKGSTRPDFSLTKIRLRVMAWIGHGQATICRLRPGDLELDRDKPCIYLRPRRKGKGQEYGKWVGLLPEAIDALRDFKSAKWVDDDGNPRVGLFGVTWSNSSAGDTWKIGIANATKRARQIYDETGDRSWLDGIDRMPPNCRPYDLRHSLGSFVYRETGDIYAVKEILQHSEIEMTERYARGGVSDRVALAISRAGTAYAAVPTLPAPTNAPAPPKKRRGLRLVETAAS